MPFPDLTAPLQPPSPERGTWDKVRDGWSHVYGSFERLGVSVELHNFRTNTALDWGRSFHPESIEICLNLTGRGEVTHLHENTALQANMAAAYAHVGEPLEACRMPGEQHCFVTLEFSLEFIARHLAGAETQTAPMVQRSVFARRTASAIGPAQAFTESQRALAQSFAQPPVSPAALPLWFQSKVMETASVFLFAPEPELFCTRQKRLTRERVERVQTILRERYEKPPSLEELSREVGVSQFYLSRLFSGEMAMTIPQYLRRIRIERAAELLREGRHNVTEAAFAVGYSSLGHFSKSFCEVIGCCPTLYPHARHLVKGGR
ncbi:MAG: AraC family transcriptional regulator [Verrucomicrobiota bacterium]